MDLIDDNFEELFDKLIVNNRSMNFFDIISPKEVIVSEWLSFIFNPSKNGVGNLTVEKLLEAVNIDKDLSELEFISTNTEVSTNKGQRMDIVIKYNGLWIVIENKIESHENGNQTEDYYKYIESIKEDNEIIYIYLKPNYNDSIPKSNNFIILTYSKLIKKLKEISEFEYNEKDKYKYLKEFLISGDMFMRNEEFDFNEAVRFYIKHKNKMNKIAEEYNNQNRKLHIKLRYDLLNYINEQGKEYLTDDDKSVSPRTYIQYFKSNWNNEHHNGAHFELMFPTEEILSDKVNCDVVFHIEGQVSEEKLEEFAKRGITKNRSLAYQNGQPISYPVILNFSSMEKYNESLNMIKPLLDKLIKEYEKIIDEIM